VSGREGNTWTSRDLARRLAKEYWTNVSIRVEDTAPGIVPGAGPGDCNWTILIETIGAKA